METNWLSSDFNYHRMILAGDIGGTNTTLALVGEREGTPSHQNLWCEGKYTIILKCAFKSNEIDGVITPIKEVITEAKKKNSSLRINYCCIGAAGPVENNYCKLTNCKWDIDGNAVKESTGIDTLIINDFSAIGYGVPTLDVNNPKQITKLPTTEGNFSKPSGTTKALVGAGTGLGVGFLTARDGKYIAHPSEGGHSGFPAFDDETIRLKDYITNKIGMAPGAEPFVSGQGISNIFSYFKDKKNIKIEGALREIDEAKDEDKPALISKNATDNEVCKNIMELFIKMYGRFAGSLAVIFLPLGGMYLAGGIVTKNEWLFLKDELFMKNFETTYNPLLKPLLKKIPVYIIRDYSISLYGAANAAVTLMNKS